VNVDAIGNWITNPATANHNYGSYNYSDSGGFLWVPPGFHF
jgi:hypothetical protein